MTEKKRVAPMSDLMRKVLKDIADGNGGFHGCHGRSEYGGRNGTLYGLRRRGLIDGCGNLTRDGLKILEHEQQVHPA